ncbi:hypothetical protein BDY24DRAFT_69198 [Mrakia frigida]|uniref:uncharacterized protein n=1 Tax=Mrakia frigida TaxID=29902 RepID=UPI003FCC0912
MAPPSPRSRKRAKHTLPFHLAVAILLVGSPVYVEALDARWAHSMVLLSSPATLLISSGKTTSPDGQTYSSSPTSSTFDLLPLTSSFSLTTSSSLSSTTSPILTESAAGTAPPYAWGNMEVLSNGDVWSFGGDGSPATAIQTGEDSVWLRDSSEGSSFAQQESGWGGEPMRRVGAASCTLGTTTYLTAGIKGDGSNLGFLTTYSFSSTTSTFTLLPSTLPLDLVQPTLHCLSNSTLLLLGGYSYTTSSLPSLGTAYTLDTTDSNAEWTTVRLGGDSVPEGRRAHLGTMFGSGNGLFVQGGGKGTNGLGEVMSDAWVLDLESGAWIAVDPLGSGPGARLGHQGVAIGSSQVLFFGGYQTSSAADASLYLYDLGTNSYLDTFTPPSTWTDTSSSPTTTTAGSEDDASSSSQTPAPIVYTSTQTIISLIPTATTIDSIGSTQTDYLTSTILSEVLQTSSEASDAQQTTPTTGTSGSTDSYVPFDPATYTGIIPGLATATGTSKATATSKSSNGAGSSDDNTAAVPLSTTSKLAIGFGVAVGSIALAAAATGLILLRRRNARNFEGGWAAGEKRGRGDGEGRGLVREEDDGEGGGWLDGREKKRMKFGAGLGAMAVGIFSGGAEKSRQARVDMLGEEDSRRFETYPPPRSPSLGEDGEERPSRVGEHGGWAGMGIWNRSSSFVGSLVGRRDASGGSGVGRDWVGLDGGDGDLGGGRMHEEDEEEGLLDINGRGANGGESPLIDDPFSDDNAFNSTSAAVAAPLQPFPTNRLNAPKTALPRSAAMTSFYPGTNHPITSGNLLPSDSTHSNSDDSHAYPLSSSNDHSSSSNSNPQTPYSASRGDGYLSTSQHQMSRSDSILSPGGGWRKVLGLRSKSPPPLTSLPSVTAMGAKMYALRDPSTPPTLDSLEDNGADWLTGFKGGLGGGGHQQDRSLSSLRSARTATSEQAERLGQMDIIQRNRTASGSTSAPSLSNSTPSQTPELGSEGQNFNFNRYPSSSSSLRQASSREDSQNPFDDQASTPTTPDLIALSPPGESSPWERSTNSTPTSRSLPIPPPTKPSTSTLNVPLSSPSSFSPSFNSSSSSSSSAYSPTLPAATRRSVRDTVAAFEQQSTPPLNIIKKEKHKNLGGTNFVAVPRAKLGIANPDGRDY